MTEEAERRRRVEDAERRRRLAAAFGEALPEGTTDEDAEGWGEQPQRSDESHSEDWLRRQVPPHHG